jgi:stage V sporulation protein G
VEITDVRVRLAGSVNDRLCGYCTITFDGEFVVRDLRIIAGEQGLFVAMPSRKVTSRCPFCGQKNSQQARYCNDCGRKFKVRPPPPREQARFHVDIAHPITPECRRMIQERVLAAFERERERSEAEPDGERRQRPEECEEEFREETDVEYTS